ncbi:hypothetical protein Cgig2_031307 [Carnegiea gigantea]|uniref:Uncharacterized protein n=1 Tax=Carnegiea gigantea TaxID=171969 RepID=A0A9Q1KMF6_9CARY|nr:hypothetical protein Cgig2_031307 [Carnegiea gigantea]
MVFSILCCITAAKVETGRLDILKSHGLGDKPEEQIPMSILWLLPQFILLGAMDGFPPSMARYMTIFTEGVFGGGRWDHGQCSFCLHRKTYFVDKAKHLNPKVGHLKVPPMIPLWFYQQGKKFFSKFLSRCASAFAAYDYEEGLCLQCFFSVMCCITAASVEPRRLGIVEAHGLIDKSDGKIPINIFWLLPQFALLEGVFGAGIMGSTLLVYIVGKISHQGSKKTSWFQSKLNRSHLGNYYWVLAALCAVNLVLYIVIGITYCYLHFTDIDRNRPQDVSADSEPL